MISATYAAEDNGRERLDDLPQPFTSRAGQAQRVAMTHLQRHRRQTTARLRLSLAAMTVMGGDTISLDYARRSWSGKSFDVATWEMKPGKSETGDVPVWYVDMTVREADSAIYDWDETQDESVALPADRNTSLNLLSVSAPVGLAVSSVQVLTGASDETFRAQVTWNAHSNSLVTASGGRFDIQYKKASDSDWEPAPPVPGDMTVAHIYMLEKSETYDVRVRAVNSVGVRSNWSSLFGFTVTSPQGATTQISYGNWTDSVTETITRGNWTDSVTETLHREEFS